jgi:hypothetical protein
VRDLKRLCAAFSLDARDVDNVQVTTDDACVEFERAFCSAQALVLRGLSLIPGRFVACTSLRPDPNWIDQFPHPEDPKLAQASMPSMDTTRSRPVDLAAYSARSACRAA